MEEATWIPSTIGLAAALGNSEPLSRYLESLVSPVVRDLPLRFDGRQHHCVMRTLRHGEGFVWE